MSQDLVATLAGPGHQHTVRTPPSLLDRPGLVSVSHRTQTVYNQQGVTEIPGAKHSLLQREHRAKEEKKTCTFCTQYELLVTLPKRFGY